MLNNLNVYEDYSFPNLNVTSNDVNDENNAIDANESGEASEASEKPRPRKRPRSELKVKKAKAKPPKQKPKTTQRPKTKAKEIVNDGDNLGNKEEIVTNRRLDFSTEVFSFRGKNSRLRDGGVVT